MIKTRKGPALWKKAKKIIPGGTNLRSKYAELFLPGKWPSYYVKAKGIKIWDMDGNILKDFSLSGIGSCILGYADSDVNRRVIDAIKNGSMSTLNCPEDVQLAKLLLQIHPWADMVRYARSGGEAMAVAVRIARAYKRKDTVAFCGYHGWHDWYISANLGDSSNLDGHLLPGLEPIGVPRCLKGSAIPFEYNRIDQLNRIVKENDIAAIVMEPMRSCWPEDDFLNKVKEIAVTNRVVLIFDEITSGFRMTVGGVHKILGVEPDMAVYAKAISNGFPMAAVVGKAEIMELAGKSFISSTYWTEKIGPAAAIATIEKIRKKNVPAHLIKTGEAIKKAWLEIASKHRIKITVSGMPPLPAFSFDYGDLSLSLQTLFTHEMLKAGYLACKSVYVSYAHKEKDVEAYNCQVDRVFGIISRRLKRKEGLSLPEIKVASKGFRRLA